MKHRLYSISILVLGLFVLAACSNEPMTSAPAIDAPAQADMYRLVEADVPGRGISYPVAIGSRTDSQVGYMIVSNDSENLYLAYTMIGDWRVKDSYIHVAFNQEEVPMDDSGKPIVERFRYNFDLERGMSYHVHRIPLTEIGAVVGQDIVIASFASVYKHENNSGRVSRDPRGQSWWFMTNYRIRRPGTDIIAGEETLEFTRDVKLEL